MKPSAPSSIPVNAIVTPSGDQAGNCGSSDAAPMAFGGALPSLGTTYRCASLPVVKAMADPSGDQLPAGKSWSGNAASPGVRLTACEPSTSTTHRADAIFCSPCTSIGPASCQKATRVPSRENVAPNCFDVDASRA